MIDIFKKKNIFKLDNIMLIIFIIIFSLVLLFYYITRINYTIDSDGASNMIYAKLLANKNSLYISNWKYGNEFYVFKYPFFSALLFKFFPDISFSINQTITNIICMSIYIYIYIIFLKCMKVKSTLSSILMFITPISTTYFDYVIKIPFYVLNATLPIVYFLLITKLSCNNKIIHVKNFCIILLAIILSFGSERYLITTFFPLFITYLSLYLFNLYKIIVDEHIDFYRALLIINIKYRIECILSLLILIFATISFCAFRLFFVKNIHYSGVSTLYWQDISFESLFTAIKSLFSCMGYVNSIKLFSIDSLYNFCFIFVLLFILVSFIYFITNFNQDDNYCIIILFIVIDILVMFGLYLFTTAEIKDRYFIHILVLLLLSIILFISKNNSKFINFLKVLLLILFCIKSIMFYNSAFTNNKNEELIKISDVLVEHNCFNGYASYWNGNILTYFSNGDIDVWSSSVASFNPSKWEIENNDTSALFQDYNHNFNLPKDRVFVLLNNIEYETLLGKYSFDDTYFVFESKNFKLYIYDNFEILKHSITDSLARSDIYE